MLYRSARRTVRRLILTAVAAVVVTSTTVFAANVVPPGLVNPPNRPMQTVHAAKCQAIMNNLVGKYLVRWSKIYGKCVGAISSCVQAKASDPACLSKAVTKCNADIPPLGDDLDTDAGTTLENAATDFCGSLSPSEAFDDAGGPQFGLLDSACHDRFGFHLSFIQNYARCLFLQTSCVAERQFLVGFPRARDLLTSAGITVGHALDAQDSCLTNENGSGALSNAKAGKALTACEVKAAKAGVAFAKNARSAFSKCADAVMTCAQLKPTQKCIDSAAKKCAKQGTAVDKKQAKLADSIPKACGKIAVDDLLGTSGGDVGALGTLCASVGLNSVATADDYGMCLARYERCQVEDSINFTVPRIQEFFTATQQPNPFNSSFCPAP